MATKRAGSSNSNDNDLEVGPPPKRPVFEPSSIGPVSSTEEMDSKLLKFQNKKLWQHLEQHKTLEDDLRARIQRQEQRHQADEEALCLVNRYWNMLDADIMFLLHRLDAESADDADVSEELKTIAAEEDAEQFVEEPARRKPRCEAVESFIAMLSSSDQQDESLSIRVNFTKNMLTKLLDAISKCNQSTQELNLKLEEALQDVFADSVDRVLKERLRTLDNENTRLQNLMTKNHEKIHFINGKLLEYEDKVALTQEKITEVQANLDDMTFDSKKDSERITKLEQHLVTANEKLKAGLGEGKILGRNIDLGLNLASNGNKVSLSQKNLDDLKFEAEELHQISSNRLVELEKYQEQVIAQQLQVDKLKREREIVPEDVIKESTEYKCLQSQFSVLYNDSIQLKGQLEEAKVLLQQTKNNHLRQIEQMESDELSCQRKLRTEVVNLEDTLAQVRKEYEMLRIEFEQNLASNEQAGPINKELRHMIQSLRDHNQMLKAETARYKRKLKEAHNDITRLRSKARQVQSHKGGEKPKNDEQKPEGSKDIKPVVKVESSADDVTVKEEDKEPVEESVGPEKQEESTEVANETVKGDENKDDGGDKKDIPVPIVRSKDGRATPVRQHEKRDPKSKPDQPELKKPTEDVRPRAKIDIDKALESIKQNLSLVKHDHSDTDEVKKLKVELRRAFDDVKEMKLLIDSYKVAGKDLRERAHIILSESKLLDEVEHLRRKNVDEFNEVKRKNKELTELVQKQVRKLDESETIQKLKNADTMVAHLQKSVANHKQEQDALQSEVEVTGQAYEDMTDQNKRLLDQLKEKDDANFKLMSERIKSNQIHKLLQEEKDVLYEQVHTLQTQVEAQNQVVRKLEDKERVLTTTLATLEKEVNFRNQAAEVHKRKAMECAQTAAELNLYLDKAKGQASELERQLRERTSLVETEQSKIKRYQEQVDVYKRKLERLKRLESANSADEVLLEEISMYKSQLRCPCCNSRDKDCVLTKCFHVFCFKCITTRYQTRQRKCPKCNHAFGSNDFHRIYI